MGHNYFFQIVGPPELRSNSCRFPRLKLASVCAQSMPRSRSFTVADGDCDFLSTRRSTHPTRRTGATPEKFPKNWGGERSTCSRCTWSTEVGPLAKTGPRVKAGGNLKLWDFDLIGGPRPPSGPPGRRALRGSGRARARYRHITGRQLRRGRRQRSARQIVASPHSYAAASAAIVSPLAYRSTMTLRSPSPSTLLRPNLVPLALARYDRCAIPPLMRCDGVAGP